MGKLIDHFIKGSNNIISLSLQEDNEDIASVPTGIDIFIGDVQITRSPDGNGVTYTAGVVDINPGLLTEDLTSLVAGNQYRVYVTITTAQDVQGVVFGGDDSDDKLYFNVSDAPA